MAQDLNTIGTSYTLGTRTLTDLIPLLYDALDVVSRELVGFIPAVTRNSSAERAAKDQVITYPIVPAATTGDIAPSSSPPDDGAQTIGSDSLTIDKSKYSPVRWSGEEQLSISANGVYNVVLRDQFAQSMRALVNLVEDDLANLWKYASRAYGTAGTTPFPTAADFSDFAGVARILDENGAPVADRQLVLGSAAIANIRGKQSVLFKANEAGTDELLRRGVIGLVEGMEIHYSGRVKSQVKGTGASYIWNGVTATAVVGTTACPVDTGSGTILAGDIVTFTGDTHQYVVKTGITSAGTFYLNKPGRLVAGADNDAVTVGGVTAASTFNMLFHRSAIHLVTRAPAMPAGGDQASDVIEIVDPISGLAFQVAMYKEYRRVRYEVGLAWGCKAAKSEHMAVLLG